MHILDYQMLEISPAQQNGYDSLHSAKCGAWEPGSAAVPSTHDTDLQEVKDRDTTENNSLSQTASLRREDFGDQIKPNHGGGALPNSSQCENSCGELSSKRDEKENEKHCCSPKKVSKKNGYRPLKSIRHSQKNFDYFDVESAEDSDRRENQSFLSSVKETFQKFTILCQNLFDPCFAVDSYDKSHATKSKVFHWSIFKHIPFVTVCFSVVFYKLGNKTFLDFLPAISLEQGLTSAQLSVLLSVLQMADMGGKLVIGFAMDTEPLRPYLGITYIVMLFLLAALNGAVPLLRDFKAFCVLAGLYGILSGASTIQRTMVVARMVDPDVLSSSYGVLYGFQGLGTLIGPPVAGKCSPPPLLPLILFSFSKRKKIPDIITPLTRYFLPSLASAEVRQFTKQNLIYVYIHICII